MLGTIHPFFDSVHGCNRVSKPNKKTISVAPLIVLSFGGLPRKSPVASLLSGRFWRPWQSTATWGQDKRLLKGWAEVQGEHMKHKKPFPILCSLLWEGWSCPFKWHLFTPEADCNEITNSSLVAYSALFCQACMFWNYISCAILVRLKKTTVKILAILKVIRHWSEPNT